MGLCVHRGKKRERERRTVDIKEFSMVDVEAVWGYNVGLWQVPFRRVNYHGGTWNCGIKFTAHAIPGCTRATTWIQSSVLSRRQCGDASETLWTTRQKQEARFTTLERKESLHFHGLSPLALIDAVVRRRRLSIKSDFLLYYWAVSLKWGTCGIPWTH